MFSVISYFECILGARGFSSLYVGTEIPYLHSGFPSLHVREFGHHRCLDLSIRTQTKGRSGGGQSETLGKRNVSVILLW